ncbi:predicted protein, partial [Nematostella vectensis]
LVSRDGGWGPWSAWTNCTRACDKGERQRHRHCDNPAPSYGGHSCRGEKQQRSACNTQPCPVHGGLSVWSTWSECGSVCEWGVKTRTRSCSGPKPRCGGKTCNATPRQTTECYHCPS